MLFNCILHHETWKCNVIKYIQRISIRIPFSELFTDDILVANTFIFFIAGFETTASTISYCLYELALNPEIQVILREKIKQTLDANEGRLTYDTLKDLKYLDMVINGWYWNCVFNNTSEIVSGVRISLRNFPDIILH